MRADRDHDEESTQDTGLLASVPGHHISSLVEKVLEYRFIAGVTAELLQRGLIFEVLRSDVDSHGHDLVIEAGGIVRHIQLKAMIAGGKRADVTINSRLAGKPSACVVWMIYDPGTYELQSFRWFGGPPGRPLRDIGDLVARHSKGTSEGLKTLRPLHRVVRRGQFRTMGTIEELVDELFGPAASASYALLLDHLQSREPDARLPLWVEQARKGHFELIPSYLTFFDAIDLAHLINGYELAATLGIVDPIRFAEEQLASAMEAGIWEGDALTLWVSLFLEHRRWRQSSPHEPSDEMRMLLDQLVTQLRSSLAGSFPSS